MEWIAAVNAVLRTVEENLCEDLSIPTLAKSVSFSPFYLQRMFAMLTDMTLGEYVRQRRLSAAGQELQATDAKVIDVALKYGYESPESFQKAFRRFHGVTPSAAKRTRVRLRYLNPLQLSIKLTGGTLMDVQFEEIGELYVMGKDYTVALDAAFGVIPGYWTDYYKNGLNEQVPGYVGLCLDNGDSPTFTYVIGCFCDASEQPPEGFAKHRLDAHLWAKFRAVGAMPDSLQQLNRRIFTEWLPSNDEYSVAEGVNLEVYSEGDMQSADYESEIWLPVVKKAR